MRTIKFRGKRCDNGEWVYGYYARLRNEFKEWHCIMTEKDASENYIKDCNSYNMLYTPVNHNTVGQFTGLYDKNGKEIYEGDIVRCNEFVYEVVYESKRFASFALRRDKDMYDHYFGEAMECDACEIIGNIHDNPELLEGGDE